MANTQQLDPEVERLLAQIEANGLADVHQLPVAAGRAQFSAARAALSGAPTPLHEVSDRVIRGPAGDIPVRLYRPSADPGLPVLVYFHGGGWVVGDLDTHDDICRNLSRHAACAVVSVDYRLAPEHRFPAALEDARAAARWVADSGNAAALGVDAERLAIGGDSAGGNLAAVLCQEREDRLPIKFQLLIYPVTDATMSFPSMNEFGEGYRLSRAAMRWYIEQYLGSGTPTRAARRDPRVSPLWAEDLAGVAPALVITAGFDPLRDEGKAYADKLAQAGVDVSYHCFEGMIHGFFGMAGTLTEARLAQRYAGEALRRAFGG